MKSLEQLQRQFQANPSQSYGLAYFLAATRSLPAARDLGTIVATANARNWLRLWNFVDSQELDPLLVQALSAALEPWPVDLRVLPYAFTERFAEAYASGQALIELPALHLIRSVTMDVFLRPHNLDQMKLFQSCPKLYKAHLTVTREHLGTLSAQDLLTNWPEGIRSLSLINSEADFDCGKLLIDNLKLTELEVLATTEFQYSEAEFRRARFRHSLRVLKLCYPAQTQDLSQVVAKLFASRWPKLKSLTAFWENFNGQSGSQAFGVSQSTPVTGKMKKLQQQRINEAIKRIDYLELDHYDRHHKVTSDKEIEQSLSNLTCDLKIRYWPFEQMRSFRSSKAVQNATDLALAFDSSSQPSVTFLNKLERLKHCELKVTEYSPQNSQLLNLPQVLERFAETTKLDTIEHLNCSLMTRDFDRQALSGFRLTNLKSLRVSTERHLLPSEVELLLQGFGSTKLTKLSLNAARLNLSSERLPRPKIDHSIVDLALNFRDSHLASYQYFLDQFAPGQIRTLEISGRSFDSTTLLPHPSLTNLEVLRVSAISQANAEQLLLNVSVIGFKKLRCIEFGNQMAAEVFELLDTMELPSLMRVATDISLAQYRW